MKKILLFMSLLVAGMSVNAQSKVLTVEDIALNKDYTFQYVYEYAGDIDVAYHNIEEFVSSTNKNTIQYDDASLHKIIFNGSDLCNQVISVEKMTVYTYTLLFQLEIWIKDLKYRFSIKPLKIIEKWESVAYGDDIFNDSIYSYLGTYDSKMDAAEKELRLKKYKQCVLAIFNKYAKIVEQPKDDF